MRPASGLVTALDPVMRASGGTWIAHGSGSADRETADAQRPRRVPPDQAVVHAAARLADAGRRGGLLLRLREQRALAALPHRLRAPGVRRARLGAVRAASTRGSPMPCSRRSATTAPIVFVQDYHFALLPRFVKEARPDVDRLPVLAHPVAEPRGVPRLPVGRGDPGRAARQRPARLPRPVPLQQLPRHRRSRARVARRLRALRGRARRPADATCGRFRSASIRRCGRARPRPRSARADVADVRSALGLGRASASSSASIASTTPRAFPSACGPSSACSSAIPSGASASTLLQVGAPSREHLQRYQALSDEVDDAASTQINAKYGTDGWKPVIYLRAAPRAGGHRRAVSRRRRLRGVVAARRHEPRRQGVHRLARRRAGRAGALANSPAPRASCDDARARQSVRRRRVRRRAARRADDAARTSSSGGCARCARGSASTPSSTGPDALLHPRPRRRMELDA